MIEIKKLPASRWKDYRDLRLEALRSDPPAFGSSYDEEELLAEVKWKRRMENVLFALSEGKPVGMIVYVFGERLRTRHVANIYGVYVTAGHRGEGVGTRLLERALRLIQKNKEIVKVKLAVNPEQLAAVKMYGRAGFVIAGRMRKEVKIGRRYYDALVMEKLS